MIQSSKLNEAKEKKRNPTKKTKIGCKSVLYLYFNK